MKIIGTFEIVDGVLLGIEYDAPRYNGLNEFHRLLRLWKDDIYLAKYFKRNIQKLQTAFWNKIINGDPNLNVTITQAVSLTKKEASEFEKEILDLANGMEGRSLDEIFIPLHKEFKVESDKFEFKAYGIYEDSWLRFYAIKYEDKLYFISGGGIKLTEKMQDSEGLDIELEKLKKVYYLLYEDPDVDADLIEKLEG